MAAVGSALSLLELLVSVVRNFAGWSRRTATIFCAAACWMLGLATVFSFSLWKGWFPLSSLSGFAKASVFDLIDYLTSNLLLPFCGVALAILTGWILSPQLLREELGLSDRMATILRALLRYIVPTGIAGVTLAPWVL